MLSIRPVVCLVLVGLFCCVAHGIAGETVVGKVVGVSDGDTITVLSPGRKDMRIRLEGIDAPESKQAYGSASKKSLSDLVFGKQVKVVITSTDDYGRKVANVYAGDTWINLAQVQRGMAWQYTHYSHDPRLRAAEVHARSQKAGLWQDKNPVPPWDFRHHH